MKGVLMLPKKSLAEMAMDESERGGGGGDDEGAEYRDVCQDVLDAIADKDPDALGEALRAAVAMAGDPMAGE